ncbi:hypothetical protein VFPFJ_01502 [Purpureocillium lilacinum]|uniref:Uncharacterized protein n=1 Tax=Purpureocillium lilacinum TaxID=33203 RepID=A0A179HZS0_PURLI|nr:hypothetical protein VFPFJ_01502 [Purpureocillium lilacinum]OAQ95392.1 hypothetical protein VFPFJ_01502 [Purpureocillium lilacinum]
MPIALPSSGSSGTWAPHCRCRVSSGPSTGALDCARLAASGFGHSDCQPNQCLSREGWNEAFHQCEQSRLPPSLAQRSPPVRQNRNTYHLQLI